MQPPPPPSLHSHFFSSLRQVEKRLKSEHPPPPPPKPSTPALPPLPPAESQIQEGDFSSIGSLSSPLFLHLDQPSVSFADPDDSSEPPQAFLSISQDFPFTHQDPPQASASDNPRIVNEAEDDDEVDEIERLMKLLGLSEEVEFYHYSDVSSCHCEGGFYSKIVGVKGPKCRKEVQRLDGWIKHFLKGDGEDNKEPLRLAHLLLGKTAFISEGADDGYGGLEFPSTIQEFLHNDPPSD